MDDNGVGKDDIALIVSDVFPRDMLASPRETVARVSEAISQLHTAGFVHRYEANRTRLLYISWWESIQRIDKPGRGRFPRPDGTTEYKASEIRESVGSPRDTPLPVTGEQGSSGTGEQGTTTARANDEDIPPEPPYDPGAEPEPPTTTTAAPTHIDNPARPTKRTPTQSSRLIVRQTLGNEATNAYPRTTIDRLAIQVENLRAEGKPDNLIREAITEWDKRENALPEWLPSVYGDIVKNQRATPGNKRTAYENKTAHNAAIFETLADDPNQLKAINS